MPRRATGWARTGLLTLATLLGIVAFAVWLSSGAAGPPAGPVTGQVLPADQHGKESAPRLDRDEGQGGHTLTRHVGRSASELRARLRREPSIAAASTFSDRDSAERAVAGALAQEAARLERWLARNDRRDLAIDFRGDRSRPLGIVLPRGAPTPLPASDARVVLRRRGDGYFVLTAYPLQEFR